MYNTKYVILGVVLFVALFTIPFWLNLASPDYTYPELSYPVGADGEMLECVEPAEWMRGNHMSMLNTWRDQALREEKRIYVSSTGKEWEISLQNTCMTCHSNYADFCETCHTQNSVEVYCWDCHALPEGNNNEF